MGDLLKDTYKYSDLKTKYGNFMVPVARITILGVDIISGAKMSVSNIDLDMGIDTASTLSFQVQNIFDLKSRTLSSDSKKFFKLGNIVTLSLGYGSYTKDVFYGYIADISTEFKESPSISITAIDIISLLMKRKRKNYTYQSKNYSEILNTILSEYPKCYKNKKIDKTNDSLEVPIQNGTDFDYIQKVICAQTNKQFLVFAGDIYLRDYDDVSKPIMELEWGVSFLSFSERKKLVNEKYTVIGKEEMTKKEITASDTAISESIAAVFKGKPMEIIINDPKIKDTEHAKAKASFFANKSLVKSKSGRLRTIGLPEIVPGRYISVTNVGSSGKYYINSVRHSFNESGFFTEAELGS